MTRFETENAVLNAVFAAEMTTLKGIEALRGVGIAEKEAKFLVYEAARLGKDRRYADSTGKNAVGAA
jgi:hypothetical protein